MLPLLCSLAIALGPAAPAESEAPSPPRFVSPSVLRLRAEADPNSAILARLRGGTALELLGEQGDRLHVRVAGRPAEHALEGWVPAELVVGRVEEADRRPLPARGDQVWFASCRQERAELVASLRADGEWVDLGLDTADGRERMRAEEMGRHLSTVDWYGPGGAAVEPGRFAAPFLSWIWGEEAGDAYSSRRAEEAEGGWAHLALGPCPAGVELLATVPFAEELAPPLAAMEVGLPGVEQLTGRELPFLPGAERNLTTSWTWWTCGEEAEERPATRWSLQVGGEERVAVGMGRAGDGWAPVSVEGARYLRLADGRRVAVLDARWDMGMGRSFVLWSARPTLLHVEQQSWGC